MKLLNQIFLPASHQIPACETGFVTSFYKAFAPMADRYNAVNEP